MPLIEGNLLAEGHRYALVAARFNRPVTERLIQGAYECLLQHGAQQEDITLIWVPGSYEIPLIAKQIALSKKHDAILCLGAVIRGETPHFDIITKQMASGIMQASLDSLTPIIFSVLTVNNLQQAETRSGIKGTNIGFSGALSAIEMVNISKKLSCV